MPAAPARRTLTRNRMGWSSAQLSPLSLQFVGFARTRPGPVLDIGAGYGAAALAALEAGAEVIAVDLDPAHLETLSRRAPPGAKLTARVARFPRDLHFEPGAIAAVHAAGVFHFLTGNQISRGLREIARWLAPGGKVFIQAATPYQAPFARFLGEYECRVRAGVRWPGWMERVSRWCAHRQVGQMPRSVHLLDDAVLRRAAGEAGLAVERAELVPRPDLPAGLRLDGREAVVLVASVAELQPELHHARQV